MPEREKIMKRTLSLFLAFIMVLMIVPFGAFTSIALETYEETGKVLHSMDFLNSGVKNNETWFLSANLSLPTGYVAKKYTYNGGISASLNSSYGVRLKGAGQSLGMTINPDNDVDQIVEIQIAISEKLKNLKIAWTPTAITNTTASPSANWIRFYFGGGPKDTSSISPSFRSFNCYERPASAIYRNGEQLLNHMKQPDENVLKTDEAFYDAIANGKVITIRISILDKKVDTVYLSCGEGDGLVTYAFKSYAGISAEGYLGIWNDGSGSDTSVDIRSIKISEHPSTIAIERDEMPYTVNFEGQSALPAGYVATTSNGTSGSYSMGEKGLTLVGSNMGIVMPQLVKRGLAHTVTVDFNVDADKSFDKLAFMWSDSALTASDKLSESGKAVAFSYSKTADKVLWESDATLGGMPYVIGGKAFSGIYKSQKGSIGYDGLKAETGLLSAAREGRNLTLSLDISASGSIISIRLKQGDVQYVYLPEEGEEIGANQGYLSIWSYGDMSDAAINIKSISVTEGNYLDPAFLQNYVEFRNEVNYAGQLKTGVRFLTQLSENAFQDLVDLSDAKWIKDVRIGTLITVTQWAEKVDEVTFASLDAVRDGHTAYINVEATLGDFKYLNTFAGTVFTEDDSRTYYARGYTKITLANGEQIITYSDSSTGVRHGKGYGSAPKYEGSGKISVIENHSLYKSFYIRVDGATLADYQNYQNKLLESGFTLHHSTDAQDKSFFSTYTDGYNIINVSYVNYVDPLWELGEVSYINIAVDSTDNSVLPKNTDNSQKVTDLQVTMINTGCAFLIRLEDGRFVVYDGGVNEDTAAMYEQMTAQNVLGGKPVVAAWFISHHHGDHIGGFLNFMRTYKNNVVVETIVTNIPSKTMLGAIIDGEDYEYGWITSLYNNAKAHMPSVKFAIAHAGQRFAFAGLDVDVLYSPENFYGGMMMYGNHEVTMYSFTMPEGRMIFIGDALSENCKIAAAIYGNDLKADVVQYAHHGAQGGEPGFYALVGAKYGIWTAAKEALDGGNGKPNPGYNGIEESTPTINVAPSNTSSAWVLTSQTTKEQMLEHQLAWQK